MWMTNLTAFEIYLIVLEFILASLDLCGLHFFLKQHCKNCKKMKVKLVMDFQSP